MIKVFLEPRIDDIGTDNGVGQVILNHLRFFPEVDIRVVTDPNESHDLSASHLGYNVDADVHHNHGLWLGALNQDRIAQNGAIVESIRRARQVIVPSEYVATYFRRDMRIDPVVIGHGVNWEEWQNADDKGYVLWDKNRPSDVCDPHAVNVLAKAFPSIPFVTTFSEESAPNNVYTIGRTPFEHMKRAILSTHIYLATTKETFGIATLQAMAAGIPIVGYNWGGTADIVRNGIDGILVEPRNEEQLKEAFANVIKMRNELGANARERARQFGWLDVVKRIRSVYERALNVEAPTVSIVIPAYNYAQHLARAVQSAARQTYKDVIEIVIVDDGSTDDTRSVAHQLMQHDARIKYVRQTNGGVANARNRGIALANGKYICCLDADDEIKPAFVETLVTALERDRSIRLAYSKLELAWPEGHRTTGDWPTDFDADAMIKGNNQVPTCCLFYKEDWQRLGGYKQRYCPKGFGAEDAEFWLRFTKHGYRAKLVTEEALFVYHLGGNTTKKTYKEPQWLDWHSDLKTGWLPFAALSDNGIHPVTEYDEPLYSVIIPVGPGHEPYVEDALDSVEAQTDKRWECIVVWNMRPEVLLNNPTVDRLHFAYPFVKFVNAWHKQGAGYARNAGAKHARGKYLVFLDADDYLQPRFLELTRKSHDAFGGDWIYTDLYTQTDDSTLGLFECYDWDVQRLWRHGIMAVTCLYPRSAYDAAGGFDETENREDWDFHMRLARHGLCGLHLPLPLFTYRQNLGFRREYRKVAKTVEESQAKKREDVRRIHATYNLQELEMACGGCKKRAEVTNVSNDEYEMMEYVGVNKTMGSGVTFIGPVTGERYRTENEKLSRVHPQDALIFEERQLFKRLPRISSSAPIITATPKDPVVEEMTWEQQVVTTNDVMMEAANDARTETERMMRQLFGDNYNEEEPSIPEPIEQDLWWQAPENNSVARNLDLLEQNPLTAEQLNTMYDAEKNGRRRISLLRAIQTKQDNV